MSRTPPDGSGAGRAGVPVLPAARFSAYRSPSGRREGAWSAAVPLSDGRVALVVAQDRPGSSGARAVVRGLLRPGADDPCAAATRLRAQGHGTGGLCVVVLDPADGSLDFCLEGRAVPLVVTADGEVRLLGEHAHVGAGVPDGEAADRLGPGDVLLLHGAAGGEGWSGATRLSAVVGEVVAGRVPGADGGTAVDRVCQRVPGLLRDAGWAGEVSLLGVQLVPPVPALALDLLADARARPTVRAALLAWCDAVGACPAAGARLAQAVDELVRNAAEHAGLGATVSLQVRAGLDVSGVAAVSVTDDGAWAGTAPTPVGAGPSGGLDRAGSLVDEVVVVPGPLGTTVTARARLDGSTWPEPG